MFTVAHTPMAVIDGRGHSYDFTEEDNFLMELNRRRIVGEGGGIGFFAGFPYRSGVLKRVLIPGTISFAYDLGRVFMNPGPFRICSTDEKHRKTPT